MISQMRACNSLTKTKRGVESKLRGCEEDVERFSGQHLYALLLQCGRHLNPTACIVVTTIMVTRGAGSETLRKWVSPE